MSYQVLARKYRPAVFKELEGQAHVLQALVNALDNERLHHAYLFTGTRGVGKTTIARILARCLNCETGVTSEPCGTCSSCVEISEGRSVDLIEVDAASRTGVDDMRELLDNVQYMPSVSRFKIYLIDEVHMLSRSSFNAMLKTLEEPPEHVKFLFATTDPKKLPITVLSRCLQFNLRNLSPEQIVKYLGTVLDQEAIPHEEAALWQLGLAADGSMRDALSLTDQAIAFGANAVQEGSVATMLGSVDSKIVFALLADIVSENGQQLLASVAQLSEFAPDYAALLDDMMGVLHRIAVAHAVPDAVDNSQGDREQVLDAAEQISAEQVQLLYQIALIGQRDLPLAPSPRTGFEMLLLRMMSFTPTSLGSDRREPGDDGGRTDVASSSAADSGRPDIASSSASHSGTNLAGGTRKSAPIKELMSAINGDKNGDKRNPTVDVEASATAQTIGQKEIKSPDEPVKAARGIEPELTGVTAVADAAVASGDSDTLPSPSDADAANAPALSPENWSEILAALDLGGVTRTLAANCLLKAANDNRCQLRLAEHHASLWNASHEDRIAVSLSKLYGQKLKVEIEVGDTEIETPAQQDAREQQERMAEAVAEIENDKRVRQLVENFNGRIDTASILPIRTGDL